MNKVIKYILFFAAIIFVAFNGFRYWSIIILTSDFNQIFWAVLTSALIVYTFIYSHKNFIK